MLKTVVTGFFSHMLVMVRFLTLVSKNLEKGSCLWPFVSIKHAPSIITSVSSLCFLYVGFFLSWQNQSYFWLLSGFLNYTWFWVVVEPVVWLRNKWPISGRSMILDSGTFVLHLGKLPLIHFNRYLMYVFWHSGPILTATSTTTTSTSTTKPKTTTENDVDSYGAPPSGGIGGGWYGGHYGHPNIGYHKKRNVEMESSVQVIFDFCNDNGDLGLTWDEVKACEVRLSNEKDTCTFILIWF